uniref:(-)-beta-pinene synthase, chloroplastic-like n=1 Tax=Erigeron canadensis TaxID=72917 RepID=UPI001CB8C110|nr:(-)-beta-pinene synthase, chloroplastic-like [Erigeron canadensis]
MASLLWTPTSPFSVCNPSSLTISKRNNNIVASSSNKHRLMYSPRCSKQLPNVISPMETTDVIVRRSANYQPSLWSYDFVQSLSSKYKEEKYMMRSQTLKEVVRTMICKEIGMVENPLSILNLVDDLQRLGISYHFVDEIDRLLENIHCNYYKNQEKWTNMDFNLKCLGFRLLRQHGYHIPQDIFSDCLDADGNFKGHLSEDITGMLNLYEASYLSVEDETILDDAREFTIKYLEKSLENRLGDQHMLSLISHALEFPLHWRVPRVEAKWYIDSYEARRSGMNPTVLELAKLDFNMVQAVHQEDLKYSSNWWKETCWENFGFGRDRLVENFMWSVAENYLPHFQGRRALAAVNALITTIDDVYDVYGTLDELEQFTNVVNSWDVNQIEDFPEYLKICFLALYNTINEISYNILTNKGVHILPYLKKAWQDLCNAYIIEARWYNDGHTPTFTEFINNAYMSIGIVTIIRHAYWLTLTSVPEDALQRIERAENMINSASLIVRLTNDIGTSSDELARGDVPKSIQCYMKETGATEVEARAYIRRLILETWKKLNKECLEIGSEYPQEFVESVVNLARMGHFMYTDRDMHGNAEMFKPYALSMFVNPIF